MLTSIFGVMKSIRLKNELFLFNEPKIMGIINLTPDSFFESSRANNISELLSKAEQMIKDGVDIFDVGGYSTRPGAADVSEAEELERVLEPIVNLKRYFPEIPISIDTFRSTVAKRAIEHGADMINDVSGGTLDQKMYQTAGYLEVPYILMHMRGNPQNMQTQTTYGNLTKEIIGDLAAKIILLRKSGVKDIIVDPGVGFAKNEEQSFTLIKDLRQFDILECPILIGVSRKSFIYKTLKINAVDSLNGTSIINTIALRNGANIIRVHDVRPAKEVIQLLSYL